MPEEWLGFRLLLWVVKFGSKGYPISSGVSLSTGWPTFRAPLSMQILVEPCIELLATNISRVNKLGNPCAGYGSRWPPFFSALSGESYLFREQLFRVCHKSRSARVTRSKLTYAGRAKSRSNSSYWSPSLSICPVHPLSFETSHSKQPLGWLAVSRLPRERLY